MSEPAMRLKFKIQRFQSEAVQSVVDCFAGQPFSDGFSYRIDPGRERRMYQPKMYDEPEAAPGWKNADLRIRIRRQLSLKGYLSTIPAH